MDTSATDPQSTPHLEQIESAAHVKPDFKVIEIADETVEDAPPPQMSQADEERAARKERLKRARNLRFTIGESDHAIVVGKQASPTNSLHDSSNTAISTPTRLILEMSSSTNLEEIFVPDLNQEAAPGLPEEEEAEKLLNYYSDDSDSEVLRGSIKGGDSVNAKTNFLDNFEIPSLTDISEDELDDMLERLKSKLSIRISHLSEESVDPGKFVDPLTGENIPSPVVQSPKSSESSTEVASESESSSISMADFKSIVSFRSEPKNEVEDIFHQFETDFILPEPAAESTKSEIIIKDSIRVTYDFLNNLIKTVVTNSENVRYDVLLNKNVDKIRLYNKLTDDVAEYTKEKMSNEYLCSKVVEYYKRTRNFRAYAKLPPEQHEKEYERYLQALTQLDFNLQLVSEAKHMNAYLLSDAMMDLSYTHHIALYCEQYLTSEVMNTFSNHSDYIKRIVERELRLMSQKRNEISDARLSLITRKHTLGRLREKIHKLQQINEDISMDDFIDIQNQAGALNKKIEERQVELKKLRLHYHSDLHVAQHCREKAHTQLNKLKVGQARLKALLKIQQSLQSDLYKAKLEHGRIRKQHSDLAYQGGILAMPSLMYDYDNTVDKVNAKRIFVNELKDTISRLNNQISQFDLRDSANTIG